MLLVRSFLFQVYLYFSVLLASLTVVLLTPFSYSIKFSIGRAWGQSMIWVGSKLCGLKFVIEGKENIPKKASVIMIRHSSVFEAYAQLVVFPKQTWIIKKELSWIPLFGWALNLLKAIPIDRSSGRAAVTQVIEKGQQRLKQGIWITIFPEGTRMKPGEIKKYGISGAALAKAADTQIVPVAHNAEDLWATGDLKKRPGIIRFCIGRPIETRNHSPKEITENVKLWIETKMQSISKYHHKSK